MIGALGSLRCASGRFALQNSQGVLSEAICSRRFQFVAASHGETASPNRVGCKKRPFCSAKLDVFVRCTLNVLASMSEFTGIGFQLQEFFRFQEKLILIARWLA